MPHVVWQLDRPRRIVVLKIGATNADALNDEAKCLSHELDRVLEFDSDAVIPAFLLTTL